MSEKSLPTQEELPNEEKENILKETVPPIVDKIKTPSKDQQNRENSHEPKPLLSLEIPSSFTGFLWEVLVGSPTEQQQQQQLSNETKENLQNEEEQHEKQEEETMQLEYPKVEEPKPPKTSWSDSWGYLGGYLNQLISISPPPFEQSDSHDSLLISPTSQTEIEKQNESLTKEDHQPEEVEEEIEEPLRLLGVDEKTKPLLTEQMAKQLRSNLPSRWRYQQDFFLIYSLQQHGISLNTFYTNLEQYRLENGLPTSPLPTFMLIQDTKGSIFGGFVTEMWRRKSGSGKAGNFAVGSVHFGRSFYGTGESFLFEFTNQELIVYSWTGKNDYFMLSEQDFIAMGSGDGKFSLYLDGEFDRGSSFGSLTFHNQQPLCSDKETGKFECLRFELWGILL